VANFHLGFLINLTKFLGFYPDEMHTAYPYFNMADGQFSKSPGLGSYLSGKDLSLFKSILGTNFDSLSALPLQANERQRLLEIAIAYCELHLSGFQKPKSIQILKELFD
jgi:DNA repair protein RecO (recombination protein O)